MVNSYVLVNPQIQGDFKNTLKANNSILAAKTFYKNPSEHFNNAVPKFHFTIQKGGSGEGKYYHFVTSEVKNNNEVTFNIKPYKMKIENMESFKSRLSAFKQKIQKGGKSHKKDKKHKKKDNSDSESSESDSSDSEEYIKNITTFTPIVNQPIYYWWYDPYVYNLNSIFIPTFYSYITPIIEYSLII